MALFAILLVITACLLSVKLYFKLTTGWCKTSTCLVGKTVLVTGATSGIGYETVLDFAKRGSRIILASITQEEGEETKLRIINETNNENIVVKLIDLSSFESVRSFAKELNSSEERLDILVNNAGITGIGNRRTRNDCLYVMQVNYLSAFLLTNLLIPLLKKSKSSRIINVSSVVAKHTKSLVLQRFNEYPGHYNTVYSQSKLCLMLFTIELAKKLKNTNITTYSVHPGVVKTNIFNNVHGFGKLIILVGKPFFKTSEEGAQTTIYCATKKGIEIDHGEHFADCRRVKRYKTAADMGLCSQLWDVTKDLVQLKSEEMHL